MRAIIPVAGEGTRLQPLTQYKPKALVEVAGKPVLEHILDNVVRSHIQEVVLIVGYMKEKLQSWANQKYGDQLKLNFVVQEQQLGLGHAIRCAGDLLDEEILIMLGDEIFERNYSDMIVSRSNSDCAIGALGTKHVNEPQHYGMMSVDENGIIQNLVEKPPTFDGSLAIAGVYYIEEGHKLKQALDVLMERDKKLGEFQLTDALQIMIDNGAKLSTFDAGDWHDCGRLETLIKSNRSLLSESNHIAQSSHIERTEIVEPCYVGPGAQISDSQMGPFVAVGNNAVVEECKLEDMILERQTNVRGISGRWGIISKHVTAFESKNAVQPD
ncbi:MAG: nucleotidyltransferase family protein [Candidatus Thorarchaeota archaeon]